MLALARARLGRAGLSHCAVRLADMYRLPLPDAAFDVAVLQMVLHYAEDPAAVLAEAARVLRPGGALIVVDLAAHERADLPQRLAHRWPGFSDERMTDLLAASGLATGSPLSLPGPLTVRDLGSTSRDGARRVVGCRCNLHWLRRARMTTHASSRSFDLSHFFLPSALPISGASRNEPANSSMGG